MNIKINTNNLIEKHVMICRQSCNKYKYKEIARGRKGERDEEIEHVNPLVSLDLFNTYECMYKRAINMLILLNIIVQIAFSEKNCSIKFHSDLIII